MKCLVIGGNGFIGSHLCEQLLYNKDEVIVMGRSNTFCKPFEALNGKVEWIIQDFSHVTDFTPYLNEVDVVYHLLSTTTPRINNQPINELYDNVIPTIKLLEGAMKTNVKKVVFASSGGAIYGTPEYVPIREDHPTNPISTYGIQKLTIEKYLDYYFRTYNLNYISLRISNPYGIGQLLQGKNGVISRFIKQMTDNEPIDIYGDGSITKDYIYIDDVVEAFIKANSYNGDEKIFNIGSGEGYSLSTIADSIAQIVNPLVKINYVSTNHFDVNKNILDIKKAQSELKWIPKYSFHDGLNETIKRYSLYK